MPASKIASGTKRKRKGFRICDMLMFVADAGSTTDIISSPWCIFAKWFLNLVSLSSIRSLKRDRQAPISFCKGRRRAILRNQR